MQIRYRLSQIDKTGVVFPQMHKSCKPGYGKRLNLADCSNKRPISTVFQGLVGPQGPIGPPGEKVSKEGTQSPLQSTHHNAVAPISECFSQDLISDSADTLLSEAIGLYWLKHTETCTHAHIIFILP